MTVPWYRWVLAAPVLLLAAIVGLPVVLLFATYLGRRGCYPVPCWVWRAGPTLRRWMDLAPDGRRGGDRFVVQCFGLILVIDVKDTASLIASERHEVRHACQMVRDGCAFPVRYAAGFLRALRATWPAHPWREALLEAYRSVPYELDAEYAESIPYADWRM